MSAPVSFSIRLDAAAVSRAAGGIDAAAAMSGSEIMLEEVSKALLQLAFTAQKERFTGQGPFPVADKKLGVLSGRLRRDLHAEPAEFFAAGIRGRIGSAVEYFGPHELGFSGNVQVPAHKRAAREVKRGKSVRTMKSGKKVSIRENHFSLLEQSVRAHTRKLVVPKREPLATAIREHSARIIGAAVRKGAKRIIEQGGKS